MRGRHCSGLRKGKMMTWRDREYPEERHADCSLWAIFRSIETP